MFPFRTILCPLEFSEASYKALQEAAALAAYFRAELVLVHAIPVRLMPP